MRKNFAQILQENKIDIKKEYQKLYEVFYETEIIDIYETTTIYNILSQSFLSFPFRGMCLTIEEFNQKFGFKFTKNPNPFDVDVLINFLEYFYNMLICYDMYDSNQFNSHFFINHINELIEAIGYAQTNINGLVVFSEKSPEAIAVAENCDISSELGYKIISYNHYSMKGNLESKKETILKLAEILEGKRNNLKKANSRLEDDLFYIFNNFNLRHNNCDSSLKNKYKEVIAKMPKKELESWYDETYRMCLLSFLEIEHIERQARFNQIKDKIEHNNQEGS